MRRKLIIMIPLFGMMFFLTNSTSVQAEDLSAKLKDNSLYQIDQRNLFEDIRESLKEGNDTTLSSLIENNSDIQISNEKLYDVSDISFSKNGFKKDMGMTNLQFDSLVEGMKDNYKKVDVSGHSFDCLGDFQSKFADASKQMSLDSAELPKGMSVGSLLNSATNSIQSAYDSAINSNQFSQIKNQVSIGKVFGIANKGLSMPELKSFSDMNQMTSGINASLKNDAYSKFSSNSSNINSNVKDLAYKTNEQMLQLQSTFLGGNLDSRVNKENFTQKAEEINNMYHDIFPDQYGFGEKTDDLFKKGKKELTGLIKNIKKNIFK